MSIEPGATPAEEAERIRAFIRDEQIRGVLLSGGGDVDPSIYGGDVDQAMMVDRARDDFEIALIQEALVQGIPVLGICRGCQILNVALGGTLRNLREVDELKAAHFTLTGHAVQVADGSTLAEALGQSRLENVYSFHGQAVDRPGEGVRTVATGPGGVTEAIEADVEGQAGWVIGVQWHPEMAVGDAIQNRLFHAFVDEARAIRTHRRPNVAE